MAEHAHPPALSSGDGLGEITTGSIVRDVFLVFYDSRKGVVRHPLLEERITVVGNRGAGRPLSGASDLDLADHFPAASLRSVDREHLHIRLEPHGSSLRVTHLAGRGHTFVDLPVEKSLDRNVPTAVPLGAILRVGDAESYTALRVVEKQRVVERPA